MLDWGHAWTRFYIHFFCGGTVTLMALWGFWIAERNFRWWPRFRGWGALVVPGLASVMLIFLREPWDVSGGGHPLKSMLDFLSWTLGVGGSIWTLYRLAPRIAAIRTAIRGGSDG